MSDIYMAYGVLAIELVKEANKGRWSGVVPLQIDGRTILIDFSGRVIFDTSGDVGVLAENPDWALKLYDNGNERIKIGR